MVMVIDDAALRVVSALVGMYDVMEHRVTLIELLSKERQPLPVRLLVCLVGWLVALVCLLHLAGQANFNPSNQSTTPPTAGGRRWR